MDFFFWLMKIKWIKKYLVKRVFMHLYIQFNIFGSLKMFDLQCLSA